MARSQPLQFLLHAVVFPADDVPGSWIAHCLELDMVTVGNSEDHAMTMLDEAIALVAARRAQDGDFPFDFRPPPHEAWDKFLVAEHAFEKKFQVPPAEVTIEVRAA
jgi:predicted RNase H-like HicB family nuclease